MNEYLCKCCSNLLGLEHWQLYQSLHSFCSSVETSMRPWEHGMRISSLSLFCYSKESQNWRKTWVGKGHKVIHLIYWRWFNFKVLVHWYILSVYQFTRNWWEIFVFRIELWLISKAGWAHDLRLKSSFLTWSWNHVSSWLQEWNLRALPKCT